MQTSTLTCSAAGASAAVFQAGVAPSKQPAFGVGFGVVFSTAPAGNLTVKVQHTFEDPESASSTWFDHPYATGLTTNTDGNYAFPVRGVRLNCTSYTAGSARLILVGY